MRAIRAARLIAVCVSMLLVPASFAHALTMTNAQKNAFDEASKTCASVCGSGAGVCTGTVGGFSVRGPCVAGAWDPREYRDHAKDTWHKLEDFDDLPQIKHEMFTRQQEPVKSQASQTQQTPCAITQNAEGSQAPCPPQSGSGSSVINSAYTPESLPTKAAPGAQEQIGQQTQPEKKPSWFDNVIGFFSPSKSELNASLEGAPSISDGAPTGKENTPSGETASQTTGFQPSPQVPGEAQVDTNKTALDRYREALGLGSDEPIPTVNAGFFSGIGTTISNWWNGLFGRSDQEESESSKGAAAVAFMERTYGIDWRTKAQLMLNNPEALYGETGNDVAGGFMPITMARQALQYSPGPFATRESFDETGFIEPPTSSYTPASPPTPETPPEKGETLDEPPARTPQSEPPPPTSQQESPTPEEKPQEETQPTQPQCRQPNKCDGVNLVDGCTGALVRACEYGCSDGACWNVSGPGGECKSTLVCNENNVIDLCAPSAIVEACSRGCAYGKCIDSQTPPTQPAPDDRAVCHIRVDGQPYMVQYLPPGQPLPWYCQGSREQTRTATPDFSSGQCIVSVQPIIVWPLSKAQAQGVPCYNDQTQQNRPQQYPGQGQQPRPPQLPTMPPQSLRQTQPQSYTPPITISPDVFPAASSTPMRASHIVTLIANPLRVERGNKARLSWAAIGLSSCDVFAEGGALLGSGHPDGSTSTPKLFATARFIARCAGDAGATATATTTITVR